MSNNILLFWELEGRWRPVLQKSFGVSRYHNIMDMVIFHYFDRATMNLQITKKRIHLVSPVVNQQELCKQKGKARTEYLFGDDWVVWTRMGIIYVNKRRISVTDGKFWFDIPFSMNPLNSPRNKWETHHEHHVIVYNIVYLHRPIAGYRAAKQSIKAYLHYWITL